MLFIFAIQLIHNSATVSVMETSRTDIARAESEMGLPHITTFCCCLGLEAGSKLIGYLHLLISLSLMVFCAVVAEGMRGLVGTVEDADGVYSVWYTISAGVAGFSVVHVMLAATLLFAVYKRNAVALRAWVWVMVALLLAALVYVVVSMTFGFSASGSDIFLQFLLGVLLFGTLSYCILCVHSFYLMLKSCEDMEGPHRTEY